MILADVRLLSMKMCEGKDIILFFVFMAMTIHTNHLLAVTPCSLVVRYGILW